MVLPNGWGWSKPPHPASPPVYANVGYQTSAAGYRASAYRQTNFPTLTNRDNTTIRENGNNMTKWGNTNNLEKTIDRDANNNALRLLRSPQRSTSSATTATSFSSLKLAATTVATPSPHAV
jgi:hypothetical protein